MKSTKVTVCPGTLAPGFDTYSQNCRKRMFSGRSVHHVLSYNAPDVSEADAELFRENRKRLSISGVQEKVSMVLEKNALRLTGESEQGTFILKPIPRDVRATDQVPANEHVTMQIARQVFGIETAENALIFFQNGDPAYLTKRFDVLDSGEKRGVEDFAGLAGKTVETAGENFKYEYSYEEIAELIRMYVPAYRIELEKFFRLVVFNYVIGNGDAHLKNFSLVEAPQGDYKMSPAYDLLCTRLHVDDPAMALKDGLFKGYYMTPSFEANGFYANDDFREFGRRIGLKPERIHKLLADFETEQSGVEQLVSRSFLSEEKKYEYLHYYRDKVKAVGYRFGR